MRYKRLTFNVRPRYTPGSPAMVCEKTALKVAAEERRAYEPSRDGVYGSVEAARAARLGLGPVEGEDGVRRSIAEETVEHANHWMVRDLVTGEVYQRPFHDKKLKPCTKCLAAMEEALS